MYISSTSRYEYEWGIPFLRGSVTNSWRYKGEQMSPYIAVRLCSGSSSGSGSNEAGPSLSDGSIYRKRASVPAQSARGTYE
jgi:hypothetical protein